MIGQRERQAVSRARRPGEINPVLAPLVEQGIARGHHAEEHALPRVHRLAHRWSGYGGADRDDARHGETIRGIQTIAREGRGRAIGIELHDGVVARISYVEIAAAVKGHAGRCA